MKKNLFFFISMIIVSVLLFLLRYTGLVPHIVVSVIGLVLMISLTVKNTKSWKIPALEVIMRIAYFVAIVTGGLIMKIQNVPMLSVAPQNWCCNFCNFTFNSLHSKSNQKIIF